MTDLVSRPNPETWVAGERCKGCAGAGWLLREVKSKLFHRDRNHLGPRALARAVPCSFGDHDDDCMMVPAYERDTVADPCPVCKPHWVHPDRRETTRAETKAEAREREDKASVDDKGRWWD